MDSGSSVVRALEGQSRPLAAVSKFWTTLFTPRYPSSLSRINDYLAIESGGHIGKINLRTAIVKVRSDHRAARKKGMNHWPASHLFPHL